MGYFIAFLKYFTEGRVKNAHFSIFDPFSPGPTGIKGATDQMLPWKAPNDPKTLPMGILHEVQVKCGLLSEMRPKCAPFHQFGPHAAQV